MADGERDATHGGVEELDEARGGEEVDVVRGGGDGEVLVVVEGSGGVAVEVVVEGRGFATSASENSAGNDAEGFDCRVRLLRRLSSCLKAMCPAADSKEPPVRHAARAPLCCQF